MKVLDRATTKFLNLATATIVTLLSSESYRISCANRWLGSYWVLNIFYRLMACLLWTV